MSERRRAGREGGREGATGKRRQIEKRPPTTIINERRRMRKGQINLRQKIADSQPPFKKSSWHYTSGQKRALFASPPLLLVVL